MLFSGLKAESLSSVLAVSAFQQVTVLFVLQLQALQHWLQQLIANAGSWCVGFSCFNTLWNSQWVLAAQLAWATACQCSQLAAVMLVCWCYVNVLRFLQLAKSAIGTQSQQPATSLISVFLLCCAILSAAAAASSCRSAVQYCA
jgi:hypothetical protein